MPFLIIIYATSSFGCRVGGKLCSSAMEGESKASYGYYYIIHSLASCIFFVISGGFSVSVDLVTLLFSLALAATILLGMLVSMLSLRYMNVLGVGLLTTPLNLLLITVFGIIIWDEESSLSTWLKILVTSLSAFLIFFDVRASERKRGNKSRSQNGSVDLKKFIPLMLFSALLGVIQTLLTKAFAVSDEVANEHSFYLLTNLVMLLLGAVIVLVNAAKDRSSIRDGLSFFKAKRVLPTVGNVVISNINTLATVPLMAAIDISLFSPLSSAYGILIGVVVSLFFREKLGIFSYLAAAVAILAIFI